MAKNSTVEQLEDDKEMDEIGKSTQDMKVEFKFLRSTYFGKP